MTTAGWLRAVLGWAGFWAEAVTNFAPLPPSLLAALFFLGLALGAYDQRRQRSSPRRMSGKIR